MAVISNMKVEDYLNNIDYGSDASYVPSDFALEFINFVKLVNGDEGEENLTPVLHYKILEDVAGDETNIANMIYRGSAKSALFAEYMFLYLAVYGEIPGFGKVNYALYISDSIENGVKKMRLRLEGRLAKSAFLKAYIPTVKFTDIRWYFKNADNVEFVVTGHGAKTGVRGTVELNTRPQLAIMDDLLSDDDARSDTVIASVEDVVYKAIDYALHPARNKKIWSGTPFNARDPLYKAIESGAWKVNVFPVCEEYPCAEEDFVGSWEDRFPYSYVKKKYDTARKLGRVDTFNQEMMLRIMSDEDRLIRDSEISWYSRKTVIENKGLFNFYITTDFATSEKNSADYSVISVWAHNNIGDWLWVDGICKKQTMDKNVTELFTLAQMYSPQSVGVEVSGQQKGFISWIQNEMLTRNIYFPLASENNNGTAGIRPNTQKMVRFNIVVPLFKTHKIFFPKELKEHPAIIEAINELSLVSPAGMKSKHDDFIDTISMLPSMQAWKPSQVGTLHQVPKSDMWDIDVPPTQDRLSSYVV